MDRCLGTGKPLMKEEEKYIFIKKKIVKKRRLFKAQNSQSIVSQQNRGKKKKLYCLTVDNSSLTLTRTKIDFRCIYSIHLL